MFVVKYNKRGTEDKVNQLPGGYTDEVQAEAMASSLREGLGDEYEVTVVKED
jgi:hypothetical protein